MPGKPGIFSLVAYQVIISFARLRAVRVAAALTAAIGGTILARPGTITVSG